MSYYTRKLSAKLAIWLLSWLVGNNERGEMDSKVIEY